jgi:alkanesulfonate monooxygenase SsuD/methylene tetrahydromethanopterin reductase-like flavin-dependent oxidoreductase (luciferase family)
MKLDFGVIDHLDRQTRPIHQTYDERLDLLTRYDKAGFYGFHLTEHHFTPLGLAPSPNIFLAAAARVTERIKLIPLVLILPLYNPLRLAGEIAMLDHLSHGRYEFATGRGISPYELAYYGINHLESPHIHREGLEVLMQALTQDVVNFRGDYYKFFDVPIELKPLQQPHPPMWYATSSLTSVEWAAKNRRNLGFLQPANRARAMTDRYRDVWGATFGGEAMPKLGLARHIYVAQTDAEAEERGRFGYAGWYEKFGYLWAKNDPRPPATDGGESRRAASMIVGSPETVAAEIARQIDESGCNYFITRFAYGELTHEESVRSLDLFVREVMPKFQGAKFAAPVGG